MAEPAIDTGAMLEALNDKVDRDCNNSIPIIPKFTLLYNDSVNKDNTIVFNDDPANYDFLVGITNGIWVIMTGKYFIDTVNGNTERVKLTGIWAGKDTYSTGFYEQTYICDLCRTSGNTFTCWSMAWSPTTTVQYSETTMNLRIFGVKL